jgi:hypothetical protein
MFFSFFQGYLGYLLYSKEENKLVYGIKIIYTLRVSTTPESDDEIQVMLSRIDILHSHEYFTCHGRFCSLLLLSQRHIVD